MRKSRLCICLLIFSNGKNTKFDNLIQDLKNSDCNIKRSAIENLGILKNPRAIKHIEEAYYAKGCSVKYDAINALRIIHHPDAIESLLKFLQDDENREGIVAILDSIDTNWRQRPEASEAFEYYLQQIQDEIQKENESKSDYCAKRRMPDVVCKKIPGKDYNKPGTMLALMAINPEKSIKPIMKLLTNQNYNMCIYIWHISAQIKSKEIVEPLIDVFFDPDGSCKYDISIVLDRIEPGWWNLKITKEKIPALLEAIEKQTDQSSKKMLIYTLAWAKDARAVPYLIKLLDDNNFGIRSWVISTLSAIQDTQARNIVRRGLYDGNESVEIDAAKAIGKMGSPEDCSLLMDALHNKDKVDHTYAGSKAAIIDSIGQLKCSSARDALFGIVENNIEEEFIKKKALAALLIIRDESIMQRLIEMLKKGRGDLLSAMLNLPEMRNANLLLPLIKDSIIPVDKNTIEILGILRDPRALDILYKAESSKDFQIRLYTEWAIWRCGGKTTSKE